MIMMLAGYKAVFEGALGCLMLMVLALGLLMLAILDNGKENETK